MSANLVIKIDSLPVVSAGVLPKNGKTYAVVALSQQHVEALTALQSGVYQALSDEQKCFLIKKDRAFFERHFAAQGVVLGCVCDGRLVAMSLLTLPSAAHPQTGMVDMCLDADLDDIAVLKGAIVHPAFRGNGLQKIMTEARIVQARAQGRNHLISEICVENMHSWQNLMACGLGIHSLSFDPADGAMLYNMHVTATRLRGSFNSVAGVAVKKNDLAAQKKLTAAGYVGVAFNAATGMITFAPPEKLPKPAPRLPP